MLAIGRALMTNPRRLILDEATEGLAPRIRGEIWRVLAPLKATARQSWWSTRTSRAVRIADRHFVLESGRTVWSGSSAELCNRQDVQRHYLGV